MSCSDPHSHQDAHNDKGRSGLKSELLQDWQRRSSMFMHDKSTRVPNTPNKATACQVLGFCVCQGIGASGKMFSDALIRVLKPLFTPPRKRKPKIDKQVETIATLPEQFQPQLPEPESHHVKQLRANRKLLVQGMVVLKISKQTSQPITDSDLDDINALGHSWAALVLSELQRNTEPLPCTPEEDQIWLHIGYVNFQIWSVTLLRLAPKGPPTTEGLQVLEIKELFVENASVLFAKLLSNAEFQSPWDVEFFLIQTDSNRKLCGEDTKPNWVLVKQFQPNQNLKNRMCFWQGLRTETELQEKQKEKEKSKRKKQAAAKPKRSCRVKSRGGRGGLTYTLSIKDASKRIKHKMHQRHKTKMQGKTQSKDKDKQDSEPAEHLSSESEADSDKFRATQHNKEMLEVENRLSARDDASIPESLQPEEDVDKGPLNSLDNKPLDDVRSQASELDLSDIEAAVVTSVAPEEEELGPFGQLGSFEPVPAMPGSSREPSGSRVPAAASAFVDAPDQDNADNVVVAAVSVAEPAKRTMTIGERRRPEGPDDSIHVTGYGEIRWNELSQRLIAVCKVPGHGDCRRSRTVNSGTRLGQGRPIGLLTHWLLQAETAKDGQSHRKMLDASIDLQQRIESRQVFETLEGSAHFLNKERSPESGEEDEPEFIR